MLKNKLVLIGLLGMLILSSCGIFHKGCGCPKFSKVKSSQFENLMMC